MLWKLWATTPHMQDPFCWPLEGVGPKNLNFFGPEMATALPARPTADTNAYKYTAAAKLMYIKLPEFLFLYALRLNDFDGGKSITWAIGSLASRVAISEPTPSNGPRNGFARIKIICSTPYKQPVHL